MRYKWKCKESSDLENLNFMKRAWTAEKNSSQRKPLGSSLAKETFSSLIPDICLWTQFRGVGLCMLLYVAKYPRLSKS